MLDAVPLPVVIVVAATADERSCSTATMTYVSYEPPRVATPLRGTTGRLARTSGAFSVSILSDAQAELAVRAARPTAGDKLSEQGIDLVPAPEGFTAPGIAGAVAVLWCRLERDDELLLVGRVETARGGEGSPLLRYRRRYHPLAAPIEVAEEAAYPL